VKELLKIRGSIAYTIALFINAFTDLGHKIIIQNTVFKIYDGNEQVILTAIVNALVLLPYILIFSPAGYLADRFAKNIIMRYSALLAVFITLGITFAYYHGWFVTAFILTFILSLQSAIYGPAKYGYIKELVGVKLLTAGNALVQATTTVAILSGIIVYTVLFETSLTKPFHNESDILKMIAPLGWMLVGGSILEFLFASRLPNKMTQQFLRRFDFKRYVSGFYLRKNLKTVTRKREIIISILAVSMFWSVSQVILAIFGAYAKDTLHIDNTIYVQGAMALAGVGIVLGSGAASKFSRFYIHIGMVPFAAFGLSLMVFLLPFSTSYAQVVTLFILFGIFSGLFLVPLSAYIQELAPRVHLGTVIAGNNFIQYIFMFFFLCLTTVFAYYGMQVEVLFYLMAAIAFAVSLYMLRVHIVMALWFVFEFLARLRYYFVYEGLENIPENTPILFLSNHISWIDWTIIQMPIKRRISFMMERDIYNKPLIKSICELGGAIPLSERASKDAFAEARRRLAAGKDVMIFPEGHISYTGELGKVHRGFELIPGKSDGVIVIVYIGGMWGSFLSRSKKRFTLYKRGWRREVKVFFSKPLPLRSGVETVTQELVKLKEEYEDAKT
jgi:acyl-[acyl-carrier-protein]-phospholipid O-acyltransferase / long-chain-fatty-acid--[acyl-carrier-protein] ligase